MKKIRNVSILVLSLALLLTSTSVNAAGFGGMNAGVSASLAEAISVNSAGIISQDVSNVEESEDDGTICGYVNLGVCIVDEGNLNVREEASTSGSMVGKMKNGAACEILDEVDGWYYITSGKVTGYVSKDYICTGNDAYELAKANVQTLCTVKEGCGGVRIRKEPNTDCKYVDLLAEGEKITFVEDLGEWTKVSMEEENEVVYYYVYSEYVTVADELPTALTMSQVRYGDGVSQLRCDLCNYALQFVGNRYVWGGTSLTNGCDCSGFVLSVYADIAGVSLPHYSGSQANCGTRITMATAQPGDLIFYGTSSRINHVALYIGGGMIVHAASPTQGIIISSAYFMTPRAVVSLLP